MRFKTLCLAGCAVSAPFGLSFLLLPALTAAQYGIVTPDASTQALARFLGATYLALAVQTLATGAVNAMGWVTVLIYGGFSAAWALAARHPGPVLEAA